MRNRNGGPKGRHFKESSNDNNKMLKNNLNDIVDYGGKLLELVNESSQLDEWMENKITVARTYLSDVTHAYMNDLKDSPCGGIENLDGEQGDDYLQGIDYF